MYVCGNQEVSQEIEATLPEPSLTHTRARTHPWETRSLGRAHEASFPMHESKGHKRQMNAPEPPSKVH